MGRPFAALAVLGAALLLPQSALAQSAMCVEPVFSPIAVSVERSAAQPDAPAPLRDEDLPWCTGADDPRCAPLHDDSTALRLAVRQPLAAATDALCASTARAAESKLTPRTGPLPHAGIRQRVERPPRPAR
jgi:hypothetical protein